jgi:uracil permease
MDKIKKFFKGQKEGVLATQHLIGMFGATTLVPVLTGMSVSVALFTAGVGTLLFHLVTKRKVPVFLGSSFAFIPGILAVVASTGSLAEAQGGIVIAGLLYLIFALLVWRIGIPRVVKAFPSHITGTIIMLIGFSLIPTAAEMALTTTSLSLLVLFVAALITIFVRGFVGQLAILISIAVGYGSALVVNLVDLEAIAAAPWFMIPNFTAPRFSVAGVALIAPIVLATFMEHIGDIAANQAITGNNFYKDPGLHRTLLGDGLATAFAGLVGGPANTTYSENTAILSITKNYDPKTIRLAAVFAIILSFSGKVSAIFQSIPTAVLGGVSLMLFWMIAKIGMDAVLKVRYLLNWKHQLIIFIMIIVGLGNGFTEPLFNFSIKLPVSSTASIEGVALAALVGVILNLVAGKAKKKEVA